MRTEVAVFQFQAKKKAHNFVMRFLVHSSETVGILRLGSNVEFFYESNPMQIGKKFCFGLICITFD